MRTFFIIGFNIGFTIVYFAKKINHFVRRTYSVHQKLPFLVNLTREKIKIEGQRKVGYHISTSVTQFLQGLQVSCSALRTSLPLSQEKVYRRHSMELVSSRHYASSYTTYQPLIVVIIVHQGEIGLHVFFLQPTSSFSLHCL